MYSPFIDKKGNPLEIRKVQFKHLEQLKECEEGHHLEFKRDLLDDGKAQLAKEIASFANCEGGWLIVGIEDKTHEINAIEKQDYSQKIGKIITRVTPYPEFETRFLSLPDDKLKGVLLVYVYEGKHTPYICNGVVYVRSGSSKEPIKPADRGNVEYLVEKAKLFNDSLEDFFRRDYYLPFSPILSKSTIPIACIYIKNFDPVKVNLNLFSERDKLIDFVLSSKNNIFEKVQYSMNSIIFMHKSVGPNQLTCILELYYDFSCKIYCPLGNTNDFALNYVRQLFEGYGIDDVDQLNITNGGTVLNALSAVFIIYTKIIDKYHLKNNEVACCVEVENVGGLILYFEGDKYLEFIKSHGVPYAHKDHDKLKVFMGKIKELMKTPLSIILNYMGPAFGLDPANDIELIAESNKILFSDSDN